MSYSASMYEASTGRHSHASFNLNGHGTDTSQAVLQTPGPPISPRPKLGHSSGIGGETCSYPLRVGAWGKALTGHPNPEWVEALLEGMRQGFRIGIQKTPRCRASPSNSPSARQHSEVIHQYVQDQLKKGYMAGPFPPAECAHIITSSMAVIPKKAAGKWRVIVDMSSPHGASVNDNETSHMLHFPRWKTQHT